jgi:hypothetical protein
MNTDRLLAQKVQPADLAQALRGALAAGLTPAEIELAIRRCRKPPIAEPHDQEGSPMGDQFWEHTTDLAAWACAAARSAVDGLDIGAERAGYRHVVNTTLVL